MTNEKDILTKESFSKDSKVEKDNTITAHTIREF